MNKFALLLLFALCPSLVLAADSSLSFAPPPSDYSVVFLGNIFGIVDGVLHGSGSQIMGTMFGVFNSAVLALGGIIIMYTLLVSTMNTAQEGQMLGQKWSSIWVPMRSTLGLALLIPKASGYCLMQIFIMWVVIQGVGAADKVWEAALGYLNRGGMIVQTQIDPIQSLTAGGGDVMKGASVILSGQVCMSGIQAALQNQRQAYLNQKSKGSGPCAGNPSNDMSVICNTPVPNFVNSINVVSIQQNKDISSPYSVSMPNFDKNNPYQVLNGICGTITWKDLGNITIPGTTTTTTSSDLQTAQMSRAIAIQQMYLDLSMVAQIMVNNNSQLNPSTNKNNKQAVFSPIADQQYGVPYLNSGTICKKSDVNCTTWGSASTSGNDSLSAPLFSGTEFLGAITDYNGIMLPTLNLMQQAKNSEAAGQQRKFLQQAQSQGWIMAGSYFFDLARLSSASNTGSNLTDSNTGLPTNFDTGSLTSAFSSGNSCSNGKYGNLCQWLNKDATLVNSVVGMINGKGISDTISWSTITANNATTSRNVIDGAGSATVFGFINNSQMVQLPNQPGQLPPTFALKFNIEFAPSAFDLPAIDFPCGGILGLCIGRLLGNVFYNLILRVLLNFILSLLMQVVNIIVMAFLTLPLMGMAAIFKNGVAYIQQPMVNPVVALANMGVNYINFANDLWFYLFAISITPIVGMILFPMIALAMPLIFTWLGTMVSIGFITAYYIPLLPYTIFTFGSIVWLISVIEAMVAAPIVALGVTHPEGHDAFGKGEQAIMILMNVFLRPAMMVIGYISAIALSYVSVWIINAGFANVISFIQGDPNGPMWSVTSNSTLKDSFNPAKDTNWNMLAKGSDSNSYKASYAQDKYVKQQAGNIDTVRGYTGWAGIYGFFFSILVYTTMYVTVVQKSFTLITYLPDKVLRWIGGQPESLGQEASQWTEEGKGQIKEAGAGTQKAAGQISQQLGSQATKISSKVMGGSKPSFSGEGGMSTPSKPE